MKFIIPTQQDDLHTIIVKLALETLNHQVILQLPENDIDQHADNVDVVWWRRTRNYLLPKEQTTSDALSVVRENTVLYSLLHSPLSQAWWINRQEAANRANFRLLQLKIACELGMTIPTTLCSNDPQEIQTFLKRHAVDGVSYQSLYSNEHPLANHSSFSASVNQNLNLYENPRQVFQSIGIFQKNIKKQYDLRAICLGHYIVAVKINYENSRDTQPIVEIHPLPQDIEDKIRELMHKIGLVFATIDFIITPDNEYIFMELNEQGQFLWIEKYNQEIKILDMFIQFLLQRSVNFIWDPRAQEHNIHRYWNQLHTTLFNHSLTEKL